MNFSKKLLKTLVLSSLAVMMMTAFASAAEGDYAIAVGNTTGSNLNLRSAASLNASVVARLAKDEPIAVLDTSNPDWYRINCNGLVGYVSSQYIAQDDDNVFELYGRVNADSVNVRKEASIDSGVVSALTKNTVVSVTGLENQWFSVKLSDETVGYIRSDLLILAKDAATASGTGSAVVDFAAKYLGTKYVYAGTGPNGFDCSGFTMYVFKQFGITLPHTASGQWTGSYGTKITSRDQLKPGDLVYFNDPSRNGGKACSHAGIYVGDSKFIHASSGKYGVVYSSLNDPYYNRYYIGGIRVI